MKLSIFFITLLLTAPSGLVGQSINSSVPDDIESSGKYVFYLHGGIIQSHGIDAVSPYWGRYEYAAILDTLKSYGYNVISEARPKDTDLLQYAEKISGEIQTLLESGVPPGNVVVIGVSMGAGIVIDVSIRVKNRNVKYAVLGICRKASWDSYLEHYSEDEIRFCGNFLSIYERSDTYGSCESYFKDTSCRSGFREIPLDMGNGHGFLYKPYDEWVHPLVEWIDNREG